MNWRDNILLGFFVGQFCGFWLLYSLVSHVLTILSKESAICLERCYSYGDFGLFSNVLNFFILREICKRRQCPGIDTLASLLFGFPPLFSNFLKVLMYNLLKRLFVSSVGLVQCACTWLELPLQR